MKTIFINIASYLDHQILLTVYDALNTAKYPDRLRFGILHQHDEDNYFLFEEFDNDKRFKIKNVHYTESNGACWARYECNKLYDNEDYVLMIDSHSRFDQDWDEEFIKMHNRCLKTSDKACISSYCTKFDSLTEYKYKKLMYMHPCYKNRSNVILFKPVDRDESKLRLHAFWGACLSFSDGKFFQEVPYDPDLYFYGEEITIAMRAWTRGWDFYLPDKSLVYHEKTKSNLYLSKRKTNHVTNPNSNNLDKKSLEKAFDICSGKIKGIYGLGNERTIKQYEIAAGINFKNNYVYHTNNPRPYPCFESYSDLEKNIIKNNKIGKLTIDWSKPLKNINHDKLILVNTIGISILEGVDLTNHFLKVDNKVPTSHTINNYFESLFEDEVDYDKCKTIFHKLIVRFFDKNLNELFNIVDNINLKLNINNSIYNMKHIRLKLEPFVYTKNKLNDTTFSYKDKLKQLWGVNYFISEKTEKYLYTEYLKKHLSNKILFIHITKNAGNGFYNSIFNFWKHSDILRYGLHGNCKSLLENTNDNFLKDNNIKVLAIYRDPFERLYSAYRYGKIQILKGNPKILRRGLRWIEELIDEQFKDVTSFESFCYTLHNCFLKKEASILKPQYKFISDSKDNIVADYIIDLKNLDKEWVKLCKKYNYGYVTPLLKTNTTGPYKYNFNKVYNKDTIKIVEKIYEKDINIYEEIQTRNKYGI